jgi:hypothetical protein
LGAIVGTALAVGLLAGCDGGDDGGGGGGGQPGIEDVLPEFTAEDGTEATLMPGQPPAASSGPTIMAPVAATVPDATTQALTVTSDEEFDSLTLAVPGTDGYWVLNFGDLGPGGGAGTGTSVNVLVTFAADPPLRNFDCLFNASNNGGAAGATETTAITIDTCTVEEFCSEECSAPEAATCAPFCDVLESLPSCAREINAPAACAAVTQCITSNDCDDAGQCAEDATDGVVDAACATETCEAIP